MPFQESARKRVTNSFCFTYDSIKKQPQEKYFPEAVFLPQLFLLAALFLFVGFFLAAEEFVEQAFLFGVHAQFFRDDVSFSDIADYKVIPRAWYLQF